MNKKIQIGYHGLITFLDLFLLEKSTFLEAIYNILLKNDYDII